MVDLPEQDKKYGKRLAALTVDDGSETYAIQVLEDRKGKCLDIRQIYFKGNQPHFGKGIRIHGPIAEVMMAAQAISESEGLI